MKILGIEGTAWNVSAAVFDPEADEVLSLVSEPYTPDEGGIHPREASEHIASHIVDVVVEALEEAGEKAGRDVRDEIEAVAFSRGPGLGPCLRVTATTARATALRLDVPLVGVNHTVAHVEMGRWSSGYEDPVTLDSAGANTLVTTYRAGRYRVLGETMDTGVGNALDKFARHAGLAHPGGPKLEKLAKDGGYVELPYTVKGLDFSFSGVVSSAQDKYDDGVPLEDLAYSLQEHVFGALVEVSERALALTRKDELVVGGGVSRNERLREMLREMCEARGARFHAPEPRFLSDNAAMIAVAGWMAYEAGETVAVEESDVRPKWRPGEVEVIWRDEPPRRERTEDVLVQGAEAKVRFEDGRFVKERAPKPYRDENLDERLRARRTRREARALHDARRAGVPTPPVFDVDVCEATLSMEALGDDLSGDVTPDEARQMGEHLACLHEDGVAHGDPTTRNAVREKPDADDERVFLVDFGLSYATHHVEDFGMDLHVFRSAVRGTTENDDEVLEAFDDGYAWERADDVRARLREIEGRGRYQ
ncbi:MAG: bifunctional N(6)-L-threonylcarbamoyladenine synthase/serine/threonine protein kinase [Halobacteriales archaeon]|nr:bifunctional N(6)-L-threonylcarbamoyladenine synthase/serine/threonine protein kinase [Halobacteriales archaeon]